MIQFQGNTVTAGPGAERVPTCDIYLRLSDARLEDALDGRESKLRAFASVLGWDVFRVVIENDVNPDGTLKPASAYKRRKIRTPSGKIEMRVIRPGWTNSILDDLSSGRANALLGEDLDRVVRDPRDMEDLIDVCAMTKASVKSLSGSLTLTDGGNENEKYVARIMVAGAAKASADTSRRVRDDRERRHGQSFPGGPRPYGYAFARNTEKYHRTLLVVDDEADNLRKWATDILERGISLRAIARELRDQGVPTVRGRTWTPHTVRSTLLKPTVAGLSALNGELKPAPWPAILDEDVWRKLKDKLEDPSRRPTTANEPRYLLSGIAKCGVCKDGTTVRATGCDSHGSGPGYICSNGSHLRRSIRYADEYIEKLVVARLSKPDVRDILKPPVRQGIDTSKLSAEARDLQRRKSAQMSLHAQGEIDDDDLKAGMRAIRDRMAVIDAQLRACDEPDQLAEFRDHPADVVWKSLTLARKRAVIRMLVDVTFLPIGHRGPGFDPASLQVIRLA